MNSDKVQRKESESTT